MQSSGFWYTCRTEQTSIFEHFHYLQKKPIPVTTYLPSPPIQPVSRNHWCIFCLYLLLLFSRSVMSGSLWLHGLQHARLPCPSPFPRVCSNSCPYSRWCHPTISSSVVPISSGFNLSLHQGLFQWVSSSHQVAKVLEFQLHHHSFQRNPRVDLLQNGQVGSPCSPRNSQESSPTPQFKSINSSALSFLHSPTLTLTLIITKNQYSTKSYFSWVHQKASATREQNVLSSWK